MGGEREKREREGERERERGACEQSAYEVRRVGMIHLVIPLEGRRRCGHATLKTQRHPPADIGASAQYIRCEDTVLELRPNLPAHGHVLPACARVSRSHAAHEEPRGSAVSVFARGRNG